MTTEELVSKYEQLDETEKRQIDEHVAQLIQSRKSQPSSLARVVKALNRIQLTNAELDEWENSLAR